MKKISNEKKAQLLKSGLTVEIDLNCYKAVLHREDNEECSCTLCNVDSNCTDNVCEVCNLLGSSCYKDPYLMLVL